jgi:hypothetical protein
MKPTWLWLWPYLATMALCMARTQLWVEIALVMAAMGWIAVFVEQMHLLKCARRERVPEHAGRHRASEHVGRHRAPDQPKDPNS